jgi:hypothetical protein
MLTSPKPAAKLAYGHVAGWVAATIGSPAHVPDQSTRETSIALDRSLRPQSRPVRQANLNRR